MRTLKWNCDGTLQAEPSSENWKTELPSPRTEADQRLPGTPRAAATQELASRRVALINGFSRRCAVQNDTVDATSSQVGLHFAECTINPSERVFRIRRFGACLASSPRGLPVGQRDPASRRAGGLMGNVAQNGSQSPRGPAWLRGRRPAWRLEMNRSLSAAQMRPQQRLDVAPHWPRDISRFR